MSASSAPFSDFGLLKVASCVLLLFFTVSATVFTEASKRVDGTYPYNTFVVPCAVEALKCAASLAMLICERRLDKRKSQVPLGFTLRSFVVYALPAFCYFVSNNCTFYIIRYLGATTFQIMNNLKILTTGVFMYMFLRRQLSWLQWKALVTLVIGCMVTQLSTNAHEGRQMNDRSALLGYALVFLSAIASSAGGVFSEKLLKCKVTKREEATGEVDSIHWKNVKLYIFGFFFGLISLQMNAQNASGLNQGVFKGFNVFAYATVCSFAVCGLLVSFILKYLDNVAKCFCSALSMLCVAFLDSAMKREMIPLRVALGMILTGLSLEQYHLSK